MNNDLKTQRVILRLEKLIEEGKHLLTTIKPSHKSGSKRFPDEGGEWVDEFLHLRFRTSSLYFISKIIGIDNDFYKTLFQTHGLSEEAVRKQIALLEALLEELNDMWFWSAQGLASAEVFSNTLEEAGHLLDKGFKIPAAVLAGCVLETHIKSLCKINGIETHIQKNGDVVPKSTAALNEELYKKSIYNLNNHKEVTNYLGVRNSAAHNKSEEFEIDQVRIMLQGIAAFVNRTPI